MGDRRIGFCIAAALAGSIGSHQAYAYDFSVGDVRVSWDTQIISGFGLRTESAGCTLVGDNGGASGCVGGGNAAQWGNGALGDLNYKAGQFYTGYLKGTSELLLTIPDGFKFMARGTVLYDEAAINTADTDLSDSAEKRVAPNYQLLDLWLSKSYTIDNMSGHIRVGNQVLNWGESYFAAGGINATNALDLQKLLIPGVQVKEAVLPAPMVSIAQGLAPGLNIEAYYQLDWNRAYFPAVGTYWSTSNQLGSGALPIYVNSNNFNLNTYPGDPTAAVVPLGPVQKPSSQGQFGVNLHYKPKWLTVDLGLYVENYHDKMPVLGYDAASGTDYWRYLADRKLYGLSANFPIDDVSVGMETSFRPHDAVSLTGCFAGNGGALDSNTNTYLGSCHQWKDMQKWQTDVVGQLNLQPSDYPVLNYLAADFGVLTAEGTWVYYPGVGGDGTITSVQGGQTVVQGFDAGYSTWLTGKTAAGYQILAPQGTANSAGLTVDFNWTYDGTVIPQWQMTPGMTFSYSFYGYTPNLAAQYEKGAKSINFYLLLNQNPSVWQAGLNFTHYFGGTPLTQPYGDRDFIGAFLTRNF